MKRARTVFLKIAIASLAPVVFLAVMEAGLRVIRFGYPSTVFIEERGRVRSNVVFTFKYFPWSMARPMAPITFSKKKPEDRIRIFVLGGSAAQGFPRSEFGISGQLEVLLQEVYPDREIEVINAAITAINSHVVLPIARACLKYEPDFLILYLGNNEVVGPFGPGTVLSEYSRSLALIRTSTVLKSTRLYQLISLAMGRHKSPTGGWLGMQMFLQNSVPLSDLRLQRTYDHLRENLGDIISAAASTGCPVILSTVGVNLLDNPPFASLHETPLTKGQSRLWDKHLAEGATSQQGAKFLEAIASYRAANQIDPGHAEVHFRLGQCYFNLEKKELASQAFATARDLDVLRFRADSQINSIIRELGGNSASGESKNVELVDGAQILAESAYAAQGLPGDALLYDHVHLSFLGNYLVARGLAERVIFETGPVRGELPTAEETARLLAFTPWDRYGLTDNLNKGLLSRPPFTYQLGHARRQLMRERQTLRLGKTLTPTVMDSIRENYEEVLSRKPKDPRLRYRYSLFLNQIGEREKAWETVQSVIEEYPHHREARMELSSLASTGGDFSEARRQLESMLQVNPFVIEVRIEFLRLLYEERRFEEAEQYGEKLVADHPRDPDIRFVYGVVLKGARQIDRAIEQFREAVRIDGGDMEARQQIIQIFKDAGNLAAAIAEAKGWIRVDEDSPKAQEILADLLAEQKQFGEAVEHYEHAIRMNPDFVLARSRYVQIMARRGRINAAIELLKQQLDADHGIIEGHSFLGLALELAGRQKEAVEVFTEGLAREPDHQKILRELAWILATTRDRSLRNGAEAVRFALAASGREPDNADFLHVLAAAYAENQQYEKAVQTAREGLRHAQRSNDTSLAQVIQQCLMRYQRQEPIRAP